MRNLISFMHVSLDGFVAGPRGELNWAKVDGEIFHHVGKRISQTDTAMYGRVTYELMESYWPTAGERPGATQHDIQHSKWYATSRKLVLSRTLSAEGLTNTTVISDNLIDRINEIRHQPGPEILLFGSPSATHALMQLNLIDGFWLFLNPILLGQGIPLFNGRQHKVNLKLLPGTTEFDTGVKELNYLVDRT